MFYFILIVIVIFLVDWYSGRPAYQEKQRKKQQKKWEKEGIRLFRHYHSIHEKNENNVKELHKRYEEIFNQKIIFEDEKTELKVLRYLIREYFKNGNFDNLTSTELKEHLACLKDIDTFSYEGFNAKLLIEEFKTRIFAEKNL